MPAVAVCALKSTTTSPPAPETVAALRSAMINFAMWAPGDVPEDWPDEDHEPQRYRYQGTLQANRKAIRFSVDVPMWTWEYPGATRNGEA